MAAPLAGEYATRRNYFWMKVSRLEWSRLNYTQYGFQIHTPLFALSAFTPPLFYPAGRSDGAFVGGQLTIMLSYIPRRWSLRLRQGETTYKGVLYGQFHFGRYK
jgi:hypothetical protein